MTRRDFNLIAETISNEMKYAQALDETSRAQTVTIAKAFARALKSTNPAFDRERFLRACGVE